jgi:hypothetical protein
MTKDWLLTLPKREEACGGSRTRLPQHPTGNLAGCLAPCLACEQPGWPVGPTRAGLGLCLLLRRTVVLALTVTSQRPCWG